MFATAKPYLLLALVALGITVFIRWRATAPLIPARPQKDPTTVSELVLEQPRALEADEAFVASIAVGELPAGAKVVVKTGDGEIIGAVAPFGIVPGMKSGDHSVPISKADVKDGRIVLHFELLETGKPGRAPSKTEIEGGRLVPVPVTGGETATLQ